MSSDHCIRFLLVKVRLPSRFRFVLPVFLPLVEETLEEAIDWMALWTWLYRSKQVWLLAIRDGLQACLVFLREIRCQGPLRLVEVETPDVRVSVDLR